jgi:hypothetical protein
MLAITTPKKHGDTLDVSLFNLQLLRDIQR